MVIYLQGQNLVTLPNSSTPQFKEERAGFEPADPLRPPIFKTGAINHSTISPFIRPICQRTFSFELRIGIEPISPDYKSGASPSMLTKQYKIKNPNFFWVRVLHSFLFFCQSLSTHKWKCPNIWTKRSIAIKRPLCARFTNDHMFIICFHLVINISFLLKV